MYKIVRYTPDEWREFSEGAHRAVFKETRSSDMDRISFALVFVVNEQAAGYATCREVDRDTVYISYGGALDSFKGFTAAKLYKLFMDYLRERYDNITTLISNQNVNMLHLAMKNGYRIVGLRNFKGEILLEALYVKTDQAKET